MSGEQVGRRPERAALWMAAILLSTALVFGGGSRGVGDLIVHAVALPAFALAILRWRHADATPLQRAFLYLLLAAAALMVLQLLPLPSALVAQLSQRAAVLQDLDHAAVSHAWLPLTLDRWGSARALLALATFAASWMLTSSLNADSRRVLLQLVLIVGFTMALLGFAQAASGVHSPLRPFEYHHPLGALGTFANRNHFADLMALLIPFAQCMGKRDSQRGPAQPLLWHGLAIVLFLAAALSYSRTGFALACVAVIAGLFVQARRNSDLDSGASIVSRLALPSISISVAVLAVGYYAWEGIVRRLDQDPLEDLRWQYLQNSLGVIKAHLPWGSGFGSFRDVYAPLEPVAEMGRTFALHAHNELGELGIEAGILGILLAAIMLEVITTAAVAILRRRSVAKPIVLAASVAVFVPLAHSLVDYPLRTLSVSSVFALTVAVLLAPAHGSKVAQGGL